MLFPQVLRELPDVDASEVERRDPAARLRVGRGVEPRRREGADPLGPLGGELAEPLLFSRGTGRLVKGDRLGDPGSQSRRAVPSWTNFAIGFPGDPFALGGKRGHTLSAFPFRM